MGLATPSSQNTNLPDTVKAEIDRLRTSHELWRVYAPEWELYLSAYEGGPDFTHERNCYKHARENQEDFKDRVARLHYINYCEPLIDFFTNFIFCETIHRDGGSNNDWYQQFISDVNMKGDDIDAFMKQVSDDIQIFGLTYVLVDTPEIPAEVGELSKADEEAQNIRPYWCAVRPDEVIDWVVDDFDKFEYVKRRQFVNKLIDGAILVLEKYTEWTAEEIVISYIDVTDPAKPKLLPGSSYPNALGEICLYPIRYRRSKKNPHMGNSFLRDFAYNNREVMNLTSLLQEFLYRQCFNILAKEVDSAIPLKDQEDGVVGIANFLEVPKGAQMPEYISPPVDPAEFIQSERSYIINEMFRRAAQDTLSELMNGEKRSGFSQLQSFGRTVPFIASRADILERAEHDLMALTLKYMGKVWDGKIAYKDRYELTSLNDRLTMTVTMLRDLFLPSPTFAKETFKQIIAESYGKFPSEVLAKIEREIDTMDWEGWQEVQKEALVGLPKAPPGAGNSPGAQQKSKQTNTSSEAKAEATRGAAATKKVKK